VATAQANSAKPARQSTLQTILQQTRNPTKPSSKIVETINKGAIKKITAIYQPVQKSLKNAKLD
jgi:hypothetical protein